MGRRTRQLLLAVYRFFLFGAALWLLVLPLLWPLPSLIGVMGFNIGFALPDMVLYYVATATYIVCLSLLFLVFIWGRLWGGIVAFLAAMLTLGSLATVLDCFDAAWHYLVYKWWAASSFILPSVGAKPLTVLGIFGLLWLGWYVVLRRRCRKLCKTGAGDPITRWLIIASLVCVAGSVAGLLHLAVLHKQLGAPFHYCWYGAYTGLVLGGSVLLWSVGVRMKIVAVKGADAGDAPGPGSD